MGADGVGADGVGAEVEHELTAAELLARGAEESRQGLAAVAAAELLARVKETVELKELKLIDLFREWDDDGNGAFDKAELRSGLCALLEEEELDVEKCDALFDALDADASGWLVSRLPPQTDPLHRPSSQHTLPTRTFFFCCCRRRP